MNKVIGKVLLRDAEIGIPDLVVSVYDVDSNSLPRKDVESARLNVRDSWQQLQGRRLGSVLSDRDGAFLLEFEDAPGNAARPDLLLYVAAPEGQGAGKCSPVLHVSCGIRQNAGRIESYLVRLSEDELQRAGVPLPQVASDTQAMNRPPDPAGLLVPLQRRYARRDNLRELGRHLAREKGKQPKEMAAKLAQVFKRVDKLLSRLPVSIRESRHYVPIDADVQQASLASLAGQIAMTNDADGAPRKMAGVAVATDQAVNGLKAPQGEFRPNLKGSEFDAIRFGTGLGRAGRSPNVLVRVETAAEKCRRLNQPALPCQGEFEDDEERPAEARTNTMPVAESATVAEQPLDVVEQLARLWPAPTNGDVAARPTQGTVQNRVDQLELRGGPADAPAYYDFHNLQIAFDHIWTEAFDQGLVEQLKELYRGVLDLGLDAEADSIEELLELGLDPIGSPADSLAHLKALLRNAYGFTIFAAKPGQRSVNFGLLVTYRQKWQPLNYQAGELSATIPLAPKEVRRFSKRQVIKKSRAEKELRNNLQSHRQDATETSRSEAEIINKANSKTAFQLGTQTGADVGFNTGVVNGSFNGGLNAGFSKDTASISEEVKREFREAVFKAAQEYKEERTLEIRTDFTEESESTESGEISNPNDELTVTYLFYELQRRYRVSEQIHRVTPVVFVAQEVPFPDQIDDDDWIIKHDWVLQRVLLDDSFRPALTYLATQVKGDEYALAELLKNLEMQRALVQELKDEIVAIQKSLRTRYAALEQAFEERAQEIEDKDEQGGFNLTKAIIDLHNPFGIGEGDKPSPEAARVREDAARDAYERAAKQEKEVRSRLDREVTALQSITEQYTKQLSEHLNRRAQIDRLRMHIKQNILYYMQSIWSYEPPDQRFFRLHRTPVPRLDGELVFNITSNPQAPGGELEYEAQCELNPNQELVALSEIADLDQLLGYKGNYLVFPLKQSNCLTDFMMVPYVDSELGLRDPDELGNWTLESFAQYVCCLKQRLSPDAFSDPKLQERLRRQYLRLLQSPRREYEEIIVPTGELFLEALPGAHPLLEDFKLQHRAIDVQKVRSEVQRQQLENLRLGARLLSGELDDPDIDRKIVIQGTAPQLTVETASS
jgi:hypothetical protein